MLEGISDGKYIIKEMGLSKFKEIVVQKVLNIPQSFFIITVDSRYPNIHIPYQKLKKIKSSYIIKLNRKGESVTPTEYKMTPPVDLRNAKLSISLGSTIMVRDLAGDYLMNDKMYESVEVGKIQKIKRNYRYVDEHIGLEDNFGLLAESEEDGTLMSFPNFKFPEAVINPKKVVRWIMDVVDNLEDAIYDCSSLGDISFLLGDKLYPFKIDVYSSDKDAYIAGAGNNLDRFSTIKIILGVKVFKGGRETFPKFLEELNKSLGHELIHRAQVLKAKEDTLLTAIPLDINKRRKYLAFKHEIMSYAWEIVETMSLKDQSPRSILKMLATNSTTKLNVGGAVLQEYHALFEDGNNVLKRLYRYMYDYAQERM